jgi:eukaryotic-like serine/threonine-protein kinase
MFAQALQMPSADARKAYLDEVCGPEGGLRQRIENLLDANRGLGEFMEHPPVPALSDDERFAPAMPLPEEGPGARIGRYKILEKLGEGGCGIVYMAEQEEPVRRRVALKVIKRGMDTESVVARFAAERQALANPPISW